MTRVDDVDARLLKVHADYLRAEQADDLDKAAELWAKLDGLLEERLHVPQQRLPSDADGHRRPGTAY